MYGCQLVTKIMIWCSLKFTGTNRLTDKLSANSKHISLHNSRPPQFIYDNFNFISAALHTVNLSTNKRDSHSLNPHLDIPIIDGDTAHRGLFFTNGDISTSFIDGAPHSACFPWLCLSLFHIVEQHRHVFGLRLSYNLYIKKLFGRMSKMVN